MPVFTRRRLQTMLNDLGPRMTVATATDLLARLEHKDTQSALAAEFELALLWGISRAADLQIAPGFPDSRKRPDALSADLFSSGPAAIEITALSDDTFSGQADMNRAGNIMAQFSDRMRKGASEHLYFEFQEQNIRSDGRNRRIRRVTKDFALSPALEAHLRAWLLSSDWPNPAAIRLTDERVDVVVRWKQYVHPLFRTFSSMPAVAYDLEDNNISKALQKKERQLSDVPAGVLKCIFLGDVGCRNLRHLRPMGVVETSGEKIIQHFLATSEIDVVCVFSPHSSTHPFGSILSSPFWTATVFDRRQPILEHEYSNLATLANVLPRPSREGNQARELHRQGLFHPQARGQYLGMRIESRSSSMTIKVSSRLVLELLAGRISQQQFQDFTLGKDKNIFDIQLTRGLTIQSAHVEKAGLDEDDDYLVFDLEHDFAASALRKPEPTA
jgi:hypothetical protein